MVAIGIIRGGSNKEIALRTGHSENSIRNAIKRMMNKIGFANRTEIALWGVARGLEKNPFEEDSNGSQS